LAGIGALATSDERRYQFMINDEDMSLASGVAAFEAKEFRRAMQLLTPLAESGHGEAQFRLAVMYQTGLGSVVNEPLAYQWMYAAAHQGHALAQHGLGVMYLYGECVARDAAEAAGWFEQAAAQGLAGALTTLAMMYREGTGVAPDPDLARKLYAKAGFRMDEIP